MIQKRIVIDEKEVLFRASASIPRLYRAKFKRDIFGDLMKLSKAIRKNENDMPIEDLELFENVSYIMAKHADPGQPDTAEDWLEQFNTFSIYQVLPEILELWNANMDTQIDGKKK